MKKKDKPLPRPPKTPFGRNRAGGSGDDQELVADKMAEAAALGNLDEFLDRELPDSEHARALAKMMMGMTGMLPHGAAPSPAGPEGLPATKDVPPQDAPAGIREAAQAGDVQGLIEMLRQEHQKRSGGTERPGTGEPEGAAQLQEKHPGQEQEVLDRLVVLAREHDVSPDWIILRALKLYFQEYERTGRL